MDRSIDITRLFEHLKDLLITIQNAKHLVDDGKEVKCSRKLQSAWTKCRNICEYLQQLQKPIVAKQDSQEHP